MFAKIAIATGAALFAITGAAVARAAGPSDAQIAHIAYTAGVIDIAAGKQALAKSKNKAVRAFAEEMVRDHGAVNGQALALVKKLGVTPQDNPTSAALSTAAAGELKTLSHLNGATFDRAYVKNEVTYHHTVNGALHDVLIPNAQNGELKTLLEAGLRLFTEHQRHAQHLAATLG